MNVGTVPSQFPSIYAINASQGSKAYLPVSPSAAIYAQFKHVSGTPAPEGVQGVNITKLKIIDTLIEQLSRVKKDAEPLSDLSGQNDEKRMNALINQYQNQLQTIQAANMNNPFAPAVSLTGALFNISV